MINPETKILIIKEIDEYTVVINKGSTDGIKPNQRFLLYSLSDEPLIDPLTNENLGYLELVKGTAEVEHLQEKICTIKSCRYTKPSTKTVKTSHSGNNALFTALGGLSGAITEEEIISDKKLSPFKNIKIGDFAKII